MKRVHVNQIICWIVFFLSVFIQEEVAEVQKQLSRAQSALSAAQQQNKRLRASLQENEQNLSELNQQLRDHRQVADDVAVSSPHLSVYSMFMSLPWC